ALKNEPAHYRRKEVFEFQTIDATRLEVARDGQTTVYEKAAAAGSGGKWRRYQRHQRHRRHRTRKDGHRFVQAFVPPGRDLRPDATRPHEWVRGYFRT